MKSLAAGGLRQARRNATTAARDSPDGPHCRDSSNGPHCPRLVNGRAAVPNPKKSVVSLVRPNWRSKTNWKDKEERR